MAGAPPLSPELWDTIPATAQAALLLIIATYEDRIAKLEARVADLEAKQGKDSTNSSKPPSTDHPHSKPASNKPKSKRSIGGQPGHPRHERTLIPSEKCDDVIPCVPKTCRNCGGGLSGTDPEPLRHQVWEIPEIKPSVVEYQQHRLICRCGCSTCGKLPEGVPTGQAGPCLITLAALLMSCFRLSKRRTALFMQMILNQPASSGFIVNLQDRASEAVAPACEELVALLPEQDILYVDESPNKEGTKKAWLWTFVTKTFTIFAFRLSRKAEILTELLGEGFDGVIHCDRAKMYWAYGRLQWCWAHLIRDFQGLIDSSCSVRRRLGHDLMRPTKEMFALWKKVRDGTLSHELFQIQMKPIRARVESLLLRGRFNARTKSICKELYKYRERLWVFVEMAGVEPTNNAAERSLRHAVIWRKLSFGTKSASGSRFVERMLTVIETCRVQKRDVFGWMVQAVKARQAGQECPSLLLGA